MSWGTSPWRREKELLSIALVMGQRNNLIPLAFAITAPHEIVTERVGWWWLAAAMGVWPVSPCC